MKSFLFTPESFAFVDQNDTYCEKCFQFSEEKPLSFVWEQTVYLNLNENGYFGFPTVSIDFSCKRTYYNYPRFCNDIYIYAVANDVNGKKEIYSKHTRISEYSLSTERLRVPILSKDFSLKKLKVTVSTQNEKVRIE
jgi:hypothetical protein